MPEVSSPNKLISSQISLSDSMRKEKHLFKDRFHEYAETTLLDNLRESDYSNLDSQKHVYLDYTGGGLYAHSQINEHMAILSSHVFGNPHSTNPTSIAITRLVNQARAYVLEFFKADPQEYVCIFTQNASGALKLVGESYPFTEGSKFLLSFDNHNSVNGIREFARSKGAQVQYVPVTLPELRLDENALSEFLGSNNPDKNNLFAYPAQSNFSGVQHDLSWIEIAHSKGWDVLLDAAAFVPTNQLDLREINPDFVVLSFYKMFGYPTGVGALIARKSAIQRMQRPWFAGGTITVASVQGDRHFLHSGAEGFEDGTLNYLSLPAVEIGLRHIEKISYSLIHDRVISLTSWLLDNLTSLKHSNGMNVVRIYGPTNSKNRGGTIAMNFFDPDGHFVDHLMVEAAANKMNISLRSGCFCNPGDGEVALGLSAQELTTCFSLKQKLEFQDFRHCLDDKSTGAVRVSVGLVSNFEDMYAMVKLAEKFIDKHYMDAE